MSHKLTVRQICEIIGEQKRNICNWYYQGKSTPAYINRVKLKGEFDETSRRLVFELDVLIDYVKNILKSRKYYNKLIQYKSENPCDSGIITTQDCVYSVVDNKNLLQFVITRKDAEENVKRAKDVYNEWLSRTSLKILDTSKVGGVSIETSTDSMHTTQINDAVFLLKNPPYNFDVVVKENSLTISWE